jgi:hypothetical protein
MLSLTLQVLIGLFGERKAPSNTVEPKNIFALLFLFVVW